MVITNTYKVSANNVAGEPNLVVSECSNDIVEIEISLYGQVFALPRKDMIAALERITAKLRAGGEVK